jgi:hypothetical protein
MSTSEKLKMVNKKPLHGSKVQKRKARMGVGLF